LQVIQVADEQMSGASRAMETIMSMYDKPTELSSSHAK